MKQGSTELVFILDRSGSMAGLEKDTIGGFNSMLERQKAEEGTCRITTVLFDHHEEILHDRIDIQAVRRMTAKEYQVGGSTALLDAVGRTIRKIGLVQKNSDPAYRAEKVLFVIITDGEENASREYTRTKVRQMIHHQQEKYRWEFIFLGANIDAADAAEHLGIRRDRAQNYHADKVGIDLNFTVMSEAVSKFRQTAEVPDDWNADIERDYRARGGEQP